MYSAAPANDMQPACGVRHLLGAAVGDKKMNLIKQTKISSAVTPTAGVADVAHIEGTILDMQGWDGVLVIVRMGAIVGGATTSIKLQQDTVVGFGTVQDIAGSKVDIAADDGDQIFAIDLYKPLERFVRVYVDRHDANATVASAEYLQYKGRKAPSTFGAHGSKLLVSPAEGVA